MVLGIVSRTLASSTEAEVSYILDTILDLLKSGTSFSSRCVERSQSFQSSVIVLMRSASALAMTQPVENWLG